MINKLIRKQRLNNFITGSVSYRKTEIPTKHAKSISNRTANIYAHMIANMKEKASHQFSKLMKGLSLIFETPGRFTHLTPFN